MTRARDASTGRFYRVEDTMAATPQALTASAEVLDGATIDRMPRSASDARQERAWRLWRILGVLHYPSSFKARQVGRLKWKVKVDGRELEDEQAEEVMKSVTVGIGVREAVRKLALNFDVAGEAYYARTSDEWQVYASVTPKRQELLKKADIVVRSWTSDPVYPDRPDCDTLAALETAEEIRLMCALSRSQDRNRLAQRGILLVPKEGQFPEDDPFKGQLERSMTAPINDEYSASAVIPLVVDYPAEYIDKWKHIVMESAYDDKLMDRIEKTIVRYAQEMDEPPELLLGNLDSNHWNAWLSDENIYRAHVEPLGSHAGDTLAKAAMKAVNYANVIEITPDPSELLARRASVSDAFEGWRLGVVGPIYVRRIMGADEDDAPTKEDLDLLIAITRGREALAPTASPVDVGTGAQPVGSPQAAPQLPAAAPTPSAAGGKPSAVKASASRQLELETLGKRLTDIDIRLLSVLEGLVQMAVSHARGEVSGDDVGAQHVVEAQMQHLGRVWAKHLRQARKTLHGLGIDTTGPQWDVAAGASVDLLVQTVTAFTMANLDKTEAEMPTMPVLELRKVLAAAGGSTTATVASANGKP